MRKARAWFVHADGTPRGPLASRRHALAVCQQLTLDRRPRVHLVRVDAGLYVYDEPHAKTARAWRRFFIATAIAAGRHALAAQRSLDFDQVQDDARLVDLTPRGVC